MRCWRDPVAALQPASQLHKPAFIVDANAGFLKNTWVALQMCSLCHAWPSGQKNTVLILRFLAFSVSLFDVQRVKKRKGKKQQHKECLYFASFRASAISSLSFCHKDCIPFADSGRLSLLPVLFQFYADTKVSHCMTSLPFRILFPLLSRFDEELLPALPSSRLGPELSNAVEIRLIFHHNSRPNVWSYPSVHYN